MPFQPFGYRFEVRSALPPDAVKAAIRARKKRLYDARSGARGWIVGSFIILMASRDRNAPMVLGRITHDSLGSGISGRAGVGLGSPVILLGFLLFLILDSGLSIPFLISAPVFGLLAIWLSYGTGREADPLIRFLRSTVEKPGKAPKPKPVVLPAVSSFLKSLTLEESGSEMDGPVTPLMVRECLEGIEGDGFVILSSADERYVQTVLEGDGYIVEKRDGNDDHHYRAARRGSPDEKDVFTFEETLTIFLAYGAGAPMPAFVEWKKIHV